MHQINAGFYHLFAKFLDCRIQLDLSDVNVQVSSFIYSLGFHSEDVLASFEKLVVSRIVFFPIVACLAAKRASLRFIATIFSVHFCS